MKAFFIDDTDSENQEIFFFHEDNENCNGKYKSNYLVKFLSTSFWKNYIDRKRKRRATITRKNIPL